MWIDYGASHHMTSQKKSLNDYSVWETPLKVKLTDDRELYAYGKVNVYLTILDGNDKINIVFKDVFFVPKLQNKLFSLPSITKKRVAVEFKGKACRITIDGKQYTISQKHVKLCKLNTTIPNKTCCIGKTSNHKPLELWHQRYGHVWYNNLKLLNNTGMVYGLNFDSKEAVDRKFEGCAMGKQHRQPFPKKAQSIITGLLELIHSNVCGPIDVPSVVGSRNFVTVIDNFSRYTTVCMIKQKSEVLAKFREFVNLVENRTGLKVQRLSLENQAVKRLRSDNGGEYVSNDFCMTSVTIVKFSMNQLFLLSTEERNSWMHESNSCGNRSINAASHSKTTQILGGSCLYCLLHVRPKSSHVFKECYTLWTLVW